MALFNRLLSALLAAGLMALGAVALVEAVSQLAGTGGQVWVNYYLVAGQLRVLTWNHPYVLGAGGLLLILGVLLIVSGLRRGPRPLALTTTDTRTRLEVPARALRRLTTNAVASAEGVTNVKVKARRRRLAVRVRTAPDPPETLKGEISDRIERQLDALAPQRRPRVTTRVKTPTRGAG